MNGFQHHNSRMIGSGETVRLCSAEGEAKALRQKGSNHDGTPKSIALCYTPKVQLAQL